MRRDKARQDEREEGESDEKNVQHAAILPSQRVGIIARFT